MLTRLDAHTRPTTANSVFSPANLAVALATLREGLTGRAAEEVDRVAALPPDRRTAFHAFLTNVGQAPDAIVDQHTGLFADPALSLDPDLGAVLRDFYAASLERVQFPDPAWQHINRWVAEQTQGRIPRLFDRLHPDDVLALVATVYLDAKWQSPFAAADTSDGPFTCADGHPVTVPLMQQRLHTGYAEAPGWQAVRLDYRGGRLAMWVLLPRPDSDANLTDLLAPDFLAGLSSRAAPRQVALTVPRWQARTTVQLAPVLQAMGMQAVFHGATDPGSAAPGSGLRLSQAVQQAMIEVGEEGTVAAAATGLTMRPIAASIALDTVTFRADRPFGYAVVDTPTGAPLFEGVLNNPEL